MIQITHENMKVSLGIPNPIINIRVVTHTAAKQNFSCFFVFEFELCRGNCHFMTFFPKYHVCTKLNFLTKNHVLPQCASSAHCKKGDYS